MNSVKRILLVSTVSRQFHLFEQVNISVLASLGVEVHGAANFRDASSRLDVVNIIPHHVMMRRSPLSPLNLVAMVQLLMIIKREKIEAVHCHSPMGGVLGRLAGILMGVHPILYTAHGFHFHEGSSRFSWWTYYRVEKYLAKYTDVLCAINDEDFRAAERICPNVVVKVPGIGIRTGSSEVSSADLLAVRRDMGAGPDDLVLISVGELNRNKNHRAVIEALSVIEMPCVKYVICGRGRERAHLERLARDRGVADQVNFLGFRDDVPRLLRAADVYLQPSLREGLPVSVLEAMNAGLPCIVSSVRGNVDLIQDGDGGYLVCASDVKGFADAIVSLFSSLKRAEMGSRNQRVVKGFDAEVVASLMTEVYSTAFESRGNSQSRIVPEACEDK